MIIGLLTLHVLVPGCSSLKQKRSLIKPIIVRLHHEFNVSAAEIDLLDMWHESILACALVSNDSVVPQQALNQVIRFFTSHWPDFQIIDHRIEVI
jgi:uncharacterized protein YlxP (DUF503 family)